VSSRLAGILHLVTLSALVACGNGDDAMIYAPKGTHCSADTDSGVSTMVDGDASMMPGPAPSPFALPEAMTSGGPLLQHATLISITFAGDPLADELEDFVASIGCSPYWTTTTAEYGISRAVASTPIRLGFTAPALLDDSYFQYAVQYFDEQDAGSPSSSGSTLYVFFVPETTTVTFGDAGATAWCNTLGGYHWETASSDGRPIPYALVARCPQYAEAWPPDETSWPVTMAASHEIVESVTDPFPYTNPAFHLIDANHPGWTVAEGPELADMCEEESGWGEYPGLPWAVSPIWSNRAASEQLNPCVPNAGLPFAYAAPDLDDPVDDAGTGTGGDASSATIHIAPGHVATVPVRIFGEGGPVSVYASPTTLTTHLFLSLDRTTADAGETLSLTISKTDAGGDGGPEPFELLTVNDGGLFSFYGLTSD